jgi:MFS family permease
LTLLFLAVFGAFTGQTILLPILPSLGRELGLSELQVGLVITAAAAMVVVASPLWGRGSDLWGRRPVLLAGMTGSALALYAFAAVSQLGLAGAAPVEAVFALMLVTRGLLFGAALAAAPVAAQAYAADVTPGEKNRARGIAAVQAGQGLSLVLGPALGGLLAGIGLLVPLYFAPTLVLLFAVLVWFQLPRPPARAYLEPPPRPSPLDARLWPFLLTGFGLFLSLGVVQVTVGFLFQDRLSLSARGAARLVGFGLFAAGAALVFAQAALVPRLGWSPLRLLRAGMPLAAAGFAVLIFADSFPLLALGLGLVGLGLGLAVPGYTVAATLPFSADEQGGVAGLIGATNALTFVFGPVVGTALYGLGPQFPYAASTVLILLLFAFVLLHPGVLQVAGTQNRG